MGTHYRIRFARAELSQTASRALDRGPARPQAESVVGSHRGPWWGAVGMFWVAASLAACGGESTGDGDDGDGSGGGGVTDGASDGSGGRGAADGGLGCVTALPVDLLFVIDDSDSMGEEQENLIANFPELVSVLTDPPDSDGDGEPDVPPVQDLRIGIVSTDMGVGPHTVSGCDAEGDRGVLVTESRSDDPGCADVTLGGNPWLTYLDGDDTGELARRFGCLAALGTGGCGLEQQLEAARTALVDRHAPGEPNEGFLRPGSLVGIVFVTDEDDCSAADPAIYDPAAAGTLGPYGTRCADHPEYLHAIDRYVDAFAGLRDRNDRVVVAAITGVPFSAESDPLAVDYDAVLEDPRMSYRPAPDMSGDLAPACTSGATGSATPGRRVVEVVRAFAEADNGLATAICNADLSPAMNAVARLIARRICPPPI